MVKIVDVARHAGVSTATVSRVLNSHPKVADDLRERVQRSVNALGYTVNVAARSLRTRKSSKILIVVPDISNPFFGDVIRGAEEAAREAGFSIIVGDTDGDALVENQYAALLDRQEVDGLAILGHRVPEPIRRLLDREDGAVPVVHACEYGPDLGLPSVHIDNVAAGADAVEHLLRLGHRHIGLVTGPLQSPLSRDRLAGARKAAEAAPGSSLEVRHGDFSIASGFAAAGELIAAGVSAIFCFGDEMALGALRALADAGLACPRDMSVVGFDDIRFAQFSQPRLTTIAQPRHRIGRTTVEILLRRLQGELDEAVSVSLPHELVVRDSTGAPST